MILITTNRPLRSNRQQPIRIWQLLIRVGLFALLINACAPSDPIKVGFVAELSGRNSVLGVQGRNGALMAVSEINEKGGVAGRDLELLVRDDAGSAEKLLLADQELIDSQVVAISGHMTSWEAITAYDLIQNQQMVLFSPTTSTTQLTGQADYFFRLIPTSDVQTRHLADYAYHTLGLRHTAILFDTDNDAFTRTFSQWFSNFFGEQGGQITRMMPYSTSTDPDFGQIVSDLRASGEIDNLLLVASSIDTALVAQQVRLQNWPVQILTSNWAYTEDLLHNGGRAVEGIVISSQFNSSCQQPAYLEFQEKYEKTYGEKPAFVAVISYETLHVLSLALEKTRGQRDGLPEAILGVQHYQGLCDEVTIDRFGDVNRSLYLFTVRGGSFEILKMIPPGP